MTSGCFLFRNEELMLCVIQKAHTDVDYEIYYYQDNISRIKITSQSEYGELSDAEFAEKVDIIERQIKRYETTKGIEGDVQVDLRTITSTVSIDLDSYDSVEDSLDLFEVSFEKSDFASIDAVRKKLQENGFQCDKVVKN